MTDVIARHGPGSLLRFALAVLLYLALYAARVPLLLAVRALTGLMALIDQAVTQGMAASVPPVTAREATP